MGPGDRIDIVPTSDGEWFFGFSYNKFPFTHTIYIGLLKWTLRLGFGASYLDSDYKQY